MKPPGGIGNEITYLSCLPSPPLPSPLLIPPPTFLVANEVIMRFDVTHIHLFNTFCSSECHLHLMFATSLTIHFTIYIQSFSLFLLVM
jgi:hypothetical protein